MRHMLIYMACYANDVRIELVSLISYINTQEILFNKNFPTLTLLLLLLLLIFFTILNIINYKILKIWLKQRQKIGKL